MSQANEQADADHGSNTIDPDRLAKELKRIEQAIEDKESYRMRYVEGCKPFNEKISNAYQIASKACGDVPIKVLKAKVRERDLLRKAEGIREDFEDDDLDYFDQVTQALGGFADTGLGKAALDAAKKAGPKRKVKAADAPTEAGTDSEAFKAGYAARQAGAKDAIPADVQGDDRDRWHNGWLAAERDMAKGQENAGKLASGIKGLPGADAPGSHKLQ